MRRKAMLRRACLWWCSRARCMAADRRAIGRRRRRCFLGVRAVIAESFERIHRSNLVGMGILPLQFHEGENAETLGLDGTETFVIEPVDFGTGEPSMPNPREVNVSASKQDGETVKFHAIVRVDTPTEGAYMAHGGILQYVLRQLA